MVDAATVAGPGLTPSNSAGTASPSAVMTPSGPPTGITSPSAAMIFAKTPAIGASTSTWALSVSTVRIDSPSRIFAPGCLCHWITVPSVIV